MTCFSLINPQPQSQFPTNQLNAPPTSSTHYLRRPVAPAASRQLATRSPLSSRPETRVFCATERRDRGNTYPKTPNQLFTTPSPHCHPDRSPGASQPARSGGIVATLPQLLRHKNLLHA